MVSENNYKNDPVYTFEVNLKDAYIKWIDNTGKLNTIK